MGFLRQITGKQARCQAGGTWETPAAEEVIRKMEKKSASGYIGRRQETVEQWVAIRPLLEFCMRETGYTGIGSEEKVVAEAAKDRGDNV